MAYNAARRRDVREAEKQSKVAEQQRAEIIFGLMSVAGGRSWMYDLLEFCSVFATTFSPNPSLAAFKEGQRNVGIRLLNDIMQSCPDQYVLMMRERNERDASRDRRTDDRDARDTSSGGDDTGPAEHTGSSDTDGGAEGRAVELDDTGWRDEVYAAYGAREASGTKAR